MNTTMLEHVADRKVMVAAVTQSTTAQVLYTHKCVEGWLDIHITLLMALLVVGVVVVLQETKSMNLISME